MLTWAAAVTGRIRLGSGVTILPLRHPVLAAKVTATLDVLSGGRFIFGVGAGWMAEEFEALDAPAFRQRGRATDEEIQIIKLLWTEREPRFEGRIYQLENTGSFPKPAQKPHPPIWVGGNGDAAIRRPAPGRWLDAGPVPCHAPRADLRHRSAPGGRRRPWARRLQRPGDPTCYYEPAAGRRP